MCPIQKLKCLLTKYLPKFNKFQKILKEIVRIQQLLHFIIINLVGIQFIEKKKKKILKKLEKLEINLNLINMSKNIYKKKLKMEHYLIMYIVI